jgi:hypothetical protein
MHPPSKIPRPKTLLQAIALLTLLLAIAPPTFAQKRAAVPASQPATPEQVYVGIYINDVYELDLKQSNYVVDFYIWFRWQGQYDPGEFEFMNGELTLKEHPYHLNAAGVNYVSFHCRGTFHILFDYRRYPLDSHQLILELEDATHDTTQMQYVVDRDAMTTQKPVTLIGWNTGDPQFEIRQHLYPTNFGEPNQPGSTSTYSRLNCSIHIARSGDSIYIKTFLGLFISVAIAFLSFLLKPSDTDPRFAVGVAAIFGAVSSEIVASGNLPDMPYLTMADKIHLFSLFMIFLSLLQSCLLLKLYRVEKHSVAYFINRLSLFAFPLFYASGVAYLTYFG